MSELTQLPTFTAQATSGITVNSGELSGKNVVIYFYPKDNTPGCTTEGLDFKHAAADFSALNTLIFGVSKDSLRTHENFRKKHEFPFELITDPDESVCRLFDVIQMKKLYGKEYLGIERSTFLFDVQGKLIKSWRKVKVDGHVEEVLATLRGR
jgi:peroxiredoxin Q/BCP